MDIQKSPFDEPVGLPRVSQNGKHEVDVMLFDESARGMAAMVDKLEARLSAAYTDIYQAEVMSGHLLQQSAEVSRFSRLKASADTSTSI